MDACTPRGVEGAEPFVPTLVLICRPPLTFAPPFTLSLVATVDTAASTTEEGTREEVGEAGESTTGRVQRGRRCNVVVPRFCGMNAAACA